MRIELDLAPGVHRIEHAYTNGYVITDDDGVTLVDGGFPSTGRAVVDCLTAVGRTAADMRLAADSLDRIADLDAAVLLPGPRDPMAVRQSRRRRRGPASGARIAEVSSSRRQSEERSLDLVQRVVLSALLVAVFGTVSVVLALYLVLRPDEFSRGDRLALWIWTGVVGLIVAGIVLVINRRRPYSPLVLLGLLPTAATAWWIF